MNDPSQDRHGFTLIEILVAVVIITILASVVAVNVLHKPGEARIAAARMEIDTLKTALQLYRTEQGRFPTQAQGLTALVAPATVEPKPTRFPQGGYLTTPELPKDPWARDYIYLIPGRRGEPFEVISSGADGEPGGEGEDADLSSSDA